MINESSNEFGLIMQNEDFTLALVEFGSIAYKDWITIPNKIKMDLNKANIEVVASKYWLDHGKERIVEIIFMTNKAYVKASNLLCALELLGYQEGTKITFLYAYGECNSPLLCLYKHKMVAIAPRYND